MYLLYKLYSVLNGIMITICQCYTSLLKSFLGSTLGKLYVQSYNGVASYDHGCAWLKLPKLEVGRSGWGL